jgi:hypothetical protein
MTHCCPENNRTQDDMTDLHQRLDMSIRSGLTALTGMQKASGGFVYRTGQDVPSPDPSYNILRHCGAIFAMVDCEEYAPASIRKNVHDGLRWVELDHLRLLVSDEDWIAAIASDDSGAGHYRHCKLGGSALYLVAALNAQTAGHICLPTDLMLRIGRFLLGMQKEDGGFHSKYDRRNDAMDTEFVSLYYPGEAALALLTLAKLDPDGPWFVAAERALQFLFRQRHGRDRVEQDHWALIASAAYFQARSAAPLSGPAVEVAAHARQVIRSMLSEFGESGGGGCFTADGRTCPTATRLEGLTSMFPHLERIGAASLISPVRDAILAAALFLMDGQITDGPRRGAFPRQSMAWLDGHPKVPAKMPDEVRIDYIQHAISGLKGARSVLQMA